LTVDAPVPNDSASWVTCRTQTCPSTTHGVGRTALNHRIALSPGLRIGVLLSTPTSRRW